MRTAAWICVVLALSGSAASAQQASTARSWDAAGTIGLFEAMPGNSPGGYDDSRYFEGRYAVSAGRYWAPHLKTELEFASTGEGSRYARRFANVPGVPPNYPYGVDEYVRLNQLSARVVWQFLENSWVHPYVLGGVAVDAERRRAFIPEQYFYSGSDPRLPANRILVTPATNEPARTVHRASGVAGAGAKIYFSPNAYFNTAIIASQARRSYNVSLIAGLGIDF